LWSAGVERLVCSGVGSVKPCRLLDDDVVYRVGRVARVCCSRWVDGDASLVGRCADICLWRFVFLVVLGPKSVRVGVLTSVEARCRSVDDSLRERTGCSCLDSHYKRLWQATVDANAAVINHNQTDNLFHFLSTRATPAAQDVSLHCACI
jgi:hypothetical protein